MKIFFLILLLSISLAQTIPPPHPPIEFEPGKRYKLEVTITQETQGVEGIRVFLVKLGPAGRILPYGDRPSLRMTNSDGYAAWDDLGDFNIYVQMTDDTGFSLRLPIAEDYFLNPLQVGSYMVQLRLSENTN